MIFDIRTSPTRLAETCLRRVTNGSVHVRTVGDTKSAFELPPGISPAFVSLPRRGGGLKTSLLGEIDDSVVLDVNDAVLSGECELEFTG
ncbi:hypothetical protein FJT64_015966 [Amphibalanus amphitrite]|uniref:Uncharacterized protein n=1 Tax=Amphibalanus amphitrite TaxID=1232801 RepID=A0A6A4X7Q7_AMPAM|nr:hypothetical protein FJT64_015966 [Amphibalanus amphitrite]